ncbi:MAG: flagellar hook-basal body complex protein FliE [Dehalococcoidia bacterium]|jgi:flagellar hook-basal body complex protein FliE|uniref:flagellar hook-basal body complex protein FliE n=1 Tax=Candidatus Amarobacter glycogenicus TaxID=3140699 RepID=UPI001D4B1AF7|nr:flagellar hook-basal body complex protein FliE [Dehalococcoidia bacterium]MBK6560664.1 flagellar hook-basal body complex protein FliE [Dehalococcoidia bacterium]MBK7124894.1 flagellar hook-basal body complex protein FliE [Dehalococcoidia bacterium]MBK7328952.1 flagellar hook-basal body complex protein FliE [Dehalococcoidia bacterium]MBK7723907.1 flagellar hook-basal body complex protein FliE [Dehalococcoidia bacterium]
MEIGRIQGVGAIAQTGATAAAKPAAGFADMLGKAIGQLQSVSDNADAKVNAMATGQDVELHDVMLAVETESLAMSLATTIRNKAVEAYQEVFRMQM